MMPVIEDLMLAVKGSALAWMVVKATAVLAIALVGTSLTRKSRAAVRHVFLTAAFGVLLAMPFASMVTPTIPIAVPITVKEGVASSYLENPSGVSSASRVSADVSTATASARLPRLSLAMLLFVGWMIVSVMFLLRVAAGLWQMRSLRGSGIPWRDGQSILEPLAMELGIQRHAEVVLHKAVSVPMTCGVLRPAILLPSDASQWAREDLRRAMIHELEHVRRGDWVIQCLVRGTCACYWFHPLVWIASRRLAVEAERACDDAVLQRADPAAYADQLVGLAERLSTTSNRPSLAMANPGDLTTRVRAVLDSRQTRGRAGGSCLVLASITAVFVRFLGCPVSRS